MIPKAPSGKPYSTNGQRKSKIANTIKERMAKDAVITSFRKAEDMIQKGSSDATISQITAMIKTNPGAIKYINTILPKSSPIGKLVTGITIANKLLPPGSRMTGDRLRQFGENAFKAVKTPSESSEMTVMNSSYGLSKAPNPKPVNLNSGVAPTCWANDFMNPIEGTCSPMHMSSQNLGLPLAPSTNAMVDYLIKTIAFDVQTRAQANINFNLDITGTFSATQIISSINDVIRALQVYYYYSSILSYEADTRNKNSAMIDLRSRITPQMISDLVSLERRLEDTPCPPRIVQWVRYMSMNYLSGNSQGSPLLKIAPIQDFDVNTGLISGVLNTISGVGNNSTYVIMRRSIPQWRIGKLYDVPVVPVFDANFLTIFANLQSGQNNSTGALLTSPPGYAPFDTTFMYNSYNNRLDGAAYAMCSAAVSANSFIPGLSIPVWTATVPSRRSFYSVSGVIGWYSAGQYPFLSVSRPETFKMLAYTDVANSKMHLPGAEMCQGVTPNSLLQSGKNFVDFLFNANSIPLNGKLSAFNRRG